MTLTLFSALTRAVNPLLYSATGSRSTRKGLRMLSSYSYETLKVTSPKQYVYQVDINRPEKRNAMSRQLFSEIFECFNQISDDPDCRSVVLCGQGQIFCAGLDLQDFAEFASAQGVDEVSRRALSFRKMIKKFQNSMSVVENCSKPVIAAVHSACVGGGVDLVSACDIRYCTQDAWFQIKEVDLGLAADIGTLQRLPKVVGNDSLARELVYTARRFVSDEALRFGFVSRVFADRDSLIEGSVRVAETIAKKSPIAVQLSKRSLVFARDHSVHEGLEHDADCNMAMLQSEDVIKSAEALMTNKPVEYSKL